MFKQPIFYIVTVALILRLIFFMWGAEKYYGAGKQYSNTDSFSYSDSAINLYEKGTLTFNFKNEEAYYGRLPGYPIIWGGIYSLVGEGYVYQVVGFLQVLLDTLTVLLIYLISLSLTKRKNIACLSALLAAGYPFIIVWNTVTATEVVATFLTALCFYWLLCKEIKGVNALVLGILIAFSFYVREYLAVLILPAILFFYFNKSKKDFLRYSFILTCTFGMLYLLWPVRNYLLFHKFIPLKSYSAGYERFALDVHSARSWMYGWTNNVDIYFDQIAFSKEPVSFPDDIFPSNQDKRMADSLVAMARECGTGVHVWRTSESYPLNQNCNLEVATGFDKLKENFIHAYPFRYYTDVPLQNFKKALFKNQLVTNTKSGSNSNQANAGLFTSILFGYRSFLLLLAIAGAFVYRKSYKMYPIALFAVVLYFFICVIFRQVEMRYLIQADVLLLVLSGASFVSILDRLILARREVYSETVVKSY